MIVGKIVNNKTLEEGDHIIFYKERLFVIVNPNNRLRVFVEDQEMEVDDGFHPLLAHASHFYHA